MKSQLNQTVTFKFDSEVLILTRYGQHEILTPIK
jgi:hypothetical protein